MRNPFKGVHVYSRMPQVDVTGESMMTYHYTTDGGNGSITFFYSRLLPPAVLKRMRATMDYLDANFEKGARYEKE